MNICFALNDNKATEFRGKNLESTWISTATATKWKNKSSVKSTNATSNKNQPTVSKLASSSNKTLDSCVNDDNSILLSLDVQLKTKTIDININTTRQFLHLVNQEYTKMKASELLTKSLNKGPWHTRCIRT
ncbi:20604_t:CDS:2 [Dentiscutata erythropus]|uniref:20604_t:CDS:1 n=1 Tax=Dentiscutata erythropus TaxID=1348616 RepID=A0A9N9AHM0_9GLOM|nr:20604_t:CDS:2 [Dentiscutata erythropus]